MTKIARKNEPNAGVLADVHSDIRVTKEKRNINRKR
jgi:hypothetical protein